MRSRQYLRGRVHGRRLAELGYYDGRLDEAGRRARLMAAATAFDGDGLEGFWRGAGEVDPIKVQALRPAPGGSRPANETAVAPRARRGSAQWVVAFLAVLFGALVCVGTIARPWRPAHLVVFAVAAAYALVNVWWLPRRASARPSAAWVAATVVGFFGGLALLALISATLR